MPVKRNKNKAPTQSASVADDNQAEQDAYYAQFIPVKLIKPASPNACKCLDGRNTTQCQGAVFLTGHHESCRDRPAPFLFAVQLISNLVHSIERLLHAGVDVDELTIQHYEHAKTILKHFPEHLKKYCIQHIGPTEF